MQFFKRSSFSHLLFCEGQCILVVLGDRTDHPEMKGIYRLLTKT